MKLARNRFLVGDAAALSGFYCDLLGMCRFGPPEQPAYGYDEGQCLLEFAQGAIALYVAAASDLYWKIGITLRNLDHAADCLRKQGWPVSAPRQFRDIGYMCHLKDPAGFSIEFLQQGFAGNAQPPGPGHPIGGQATLAHLTLRVCDLAAAQAFFAKRLGMRLFSIQRVPEREFSLYFYGWGDEPLPNPDLEAVENREWLWARPYTLLELQHLEGATPIGHREENAAGFAGFGYENDQAGARFLSSAELAKRLRISS